MREDFHAAERMRQSKYSERENYEKFRDIKNVVKTFFYRFIV